MVIKTSTILTVDLGIYHPLTINLEIWYRIHLLDAFRRLIIKDLKRLAVLHRKFVVDVAGGFGISEVSGVRPQQCQILKPDT